MHPDPLLTVGGCESGEPFVFGGESVRVLSGFLRVPKNRKLESFAFIDRGSSKLPLTVDDSRDAQLAVTPVY